MLIEYYFRIKYTRGINNIKVNIFSKKVKLQDNKKIERAILKWIEIARLDITTYSLQ